MYEPNKHEMQYLLPEEVLRKIILLYRNSASARGSIVGRMVYLQIIDHDHFTTLAQDNRYQDTSPSDQEAMRLEPAPSVTPSGACHCCVTGARAEGLPWKRLGQALHSGTGSVSIR